MFGLLMTISVVLSVMLIIIILLQSSKGGGLAGTFGGAGGTFGNVFGTRRTADFLSRATWWIGGSLLVLAIVINLFFLPSQMTSEQRESIIQSSRQNAEAPVTPTLPPENIGDEGGTDQGTQTNGEDNPQ